MPKLAFDFDAFASLHDPREVPTYTIAEAAHYLSIPIATVRAWVKGTSYSDASGNRRRFQRVIETHDPKRSLLSFFNLAEAHILRALRTDHRIRLQDIRKALDFVRKEFGWERPLIHTAFATDGASLFVEQFGKLIDASASGQLAIPEVLAAHLDRLEWEEGLAARLHPFTRLRATIDAPRSILIDPLHAFGRPLIANLGVTTSVVAERYKSGDSIEYLVREYGGRQADIEEAIRCELQIAAAA